MRLLLVLVIGRTNVTAACPHDEFQLAHVIFSSAIFTRVGCRAGVCRHTGVARRYARVYHRKIFFWLDRFDLILEVHALTLTMFRLDAVHIWERGAEGVEEVGATGRKSGET